MLGFGRDAQGQARLGTVGLKDLITRSGATTPAYVYDLGAIAAEAGTAVQAFGDAPGLVAYAIKANAAGSIVRTIIEQGAGADVVSGGELALALACGAPADRIVMSGVGKTNEEIDQAISAGILALQAESVGEIDRIAVRARNRGLKARVSLRINPSVQIDSHAHIATGHDEAKFGIGLSELGGAWDRVDASADAIEAVGVSTHVGSMLDRPDAYVKAARVVCSAAKARRERRGNLTFVDFGGGFGIDYGGRPVRSLSDFVKASLGVLAEYRLNDLRLVIEPGRALVGPHGVLVARVIAEKQTRGRRWLFIDAGMNDLMRPALYGARHRIEPLERLPSSPAWRVAGPVCESADDFGEHELGQPAPEFVVIRDAAAYGFAMANEYNGRSLPAEVFVRAGSVFKISAAPGTQSWVARRLDA